MILRVLGRALYVLMAEHTTVTLNKQLPVDCYFINGTTKNRMRKLINITTNNVENLKKKFFHLSKSDVW